MLRNRYSRDDPLWLDVPRDIVSMMQKCNGLWLYYCDVLISSDQVLTICLCSLCMLICICFICLFPTGGAGHAHHWDTWTTHWDPYLSLLTALSTSPEARRSCISFASMDMARAASTVLHLMCKMAVITSILSSFNVYLSPWCLSTIIS